MKTNKRRTQCPEKIGHLCLRFGHFCLTEASFAENYCFWTTDCQINSVFHGFFCASYRPFAQDESWIYPVLQVRGSSILHGGKPRTYSTGRYGARDRFFKHPFLPFHKIVTCLRSLSKRFLPAGSTRSSFSRRFAHKALCRTKVLLTVTEFGDINSFRDSWGRIPGVILRIEAMPVCDGSRIDDKKFSS